MYGPRAASSRYVISSPDTFNSGICKSQDIVSTLVGPRTGARPLNLREHLETCYRSDVSIWTYFDVGKTRPAVHRELEVSSLVSACLFESTA